MAGWATGFGYAAPQNGRGRGGNGGQPYTRQERELATRVGCSCAEARGMLMKGGHINDGYAGCGVQPLMAAVDGNGCPVERQECQNRVTLSATTLADGDVVRFEVTPVGAEAVLRELYHITGAAGIIITSIAARGVEFLSGTVASNGTGNVATGIESLSYARDFRNFAAPGGDRPILFDPSRHLFITVQNQSGGAIAAYTLVAAYDEVRPS